MIWWVKPHDLSVQTPPKKNPGNSISQQSRSSLVYFRMIKPSMSCKTRLGIHRVGSWGEPSLRGKVGGGTPTWGTRNKLAKQGFKIGCYWKWWSFHGATFKNFSGEIVWCVIQLMANCFWFQIIKNENNRVKLTIFIHLKPLGRGSGHVTNAKKKLMFKLRY